MFDVLAISTVRSSSERPVRGSSSVEISCEHVGQLVAALAAATYTITSASHHLAICCSSTVLPVPKPPGTAAVAPRATGNRRSSARWPVTSGTEASRRGASGAAAARATAARARSSRPPTCRSARPRCTRPRARSTRRCRPPRAARARACSIATRLGDASRVPRRPRRIAGRDRRGEAPAAVRRQRRRAGAGGEAVAECVEPPQHAVEDAAEQTRAELRRSAGRRQARPGARAQGRPCTRGPGRSRRRRAAR